ncbi:DUF1697 domain-containing protein [Sphingomonas sp. G-3-2-10]|uniref:DUF1697 domain-containing protein n=1 Tax=Sphingomonas sp. G-3-2-10 TaxID=2728838 RepID=UPI00146B2342|nr:DUF1697 domain-containing protein [Sphingomonas sp. G-3-2-10]
MKRRAALLKGVNVGGNRKLPMADLRKLVEDLGYGDVKTLLASGNVVFDAPGEATALETKLEAALETLGVKTDILIRDAADIAKIIEDNPFADAAKDHPNHLMVHFHRDPFPDGLIERIPDLYEGPERLHAVGRTLYVDFPRDIGHSKLPQAMARAKFPKLNTARNWNTVTKLLAMLEK